MIKPSLFITFLLVAGLSAAIYGVENRVHALRKELSAMQQDIVTDREELHVLKAEWAYLTRPARIAELADKHLKVEAVTADRIIDVQQVALESGNNSPFDVLKEYTLTQRY